MNVHAETTYQIDTLMAKDLDYEDVWRFETRCFHVVPLAEGGEARKEIASLDGLLCAPGYVPGTQGYDDTFDVFDSRSGHACAAFEVISDNQDCIDQALGGMGLLLQGSGLILLERGFVESKHRGNKIMLRMMRDARKATSGLGRVAMLQAFPDGNEISDQDCRQLAQYYASDTALSFIEIAPSALAGWMVANWST
ncbi:hypothetical protein [Phaeobacter inhibens]|uniref:hypothetical protein n=1 Tax=Phaeobacter inhibens TaxID=221822 RepID=UPI000C9B01C8|nr:hypothetical protein [Phaeobacter inhibens]AUR06972.1 hypothetical protein PhaeoP59_00772 [Phaeobacter inhibens]